MLSLLTQFPQRLYISIQSTYIGYQRMLERIGLPDDVLRVGIGKKVDGQWGRIAQTL